VGDQRRTSSGATFGAAHAGGVVVPTEVAHEAAAAGASPRSFAREVETGLKSELTHDLGRSRFRLWFRDVEVVSVEGDTLTLAVPTEVHRSWIEYTFGDEVRRASERVLGRGVKLELRVGVAQGEKRALREKLPQRPDAWERRLLEERPVPTFAAFCAQRHDRWAVTLLEQLVHGGGPSAGPTIYLYGESGCGKTHLLEALASAVQAHAPGECLYLTARRFTAIVAAALRSGTPTALRTLHADLASRRVLLIDAVEALEGRKATQAELVRALDRAALGGPRLVLAGQRHPAEMEGLAPTLASRLVGGPVVRLALPDRALLCEILTARAAACRLAAPAELVEAIVERTRSPHTAMLWLDRWVVASRDLGRPLEAVWLAEIAPPASTSAGEDVIRRAKDRVAEHFGVEVGLLERATKARSAALPRAAALYLVWRSTAMSLTRLARAFGYRSHSSVSRALAGIRSKRTGDAVLEQTLDGLLARL